MAFSLTAFRAYGVDIAGPSKKRGIQRAELVITAAANTDSDLDIGDPSGTFWTAVGTTANTFGGNALATLQAIALKATALVAVTGEPFLTRLKSAAGAGASEYAIGVSSKLPNITWNSGTAPTSSYTIQLEWILNDYQIPTSADAALVT